MRIAMACAVALFLSAMVGLGQQTGGQQQRVLQPSAEVQKALVLEQQGKYAEAEAAWQTVVKAEPRNGRAYAHLGLLEARQEHYPKAIAYYKKAQALDRVDPSLSKAIPQLNLDLGLAFFKSTDFKNAAAVFETELRKHPQSPDAKRLTILAGMSHYGAHEYGAAIPYLKEASTADPRNLSLLLTLAHCYLWTKQLDAIMGVYKEILTINPDSAEADMIAGEALDEKGDRNGAVEQFRAAEKANPREPNLHFALAYVLWTLKNYDEAIPEFQAELDNDPKNYQDMVYLADSYVQKNQFDEAKQILLKIVPFQGTTPLVHLDLGIVYMESGANDAAIQELKKTVAMEPDNVNAHVRLGTIYRTMGKKDEAKAEFVKASSLNRKRDDSVFQQIVAAHARPDTDTKAAQPEKPDAAANPDQR